MKLGDASVRRDPPVRRPERTVFGLLTYPAKMAALVLGHILFLAVLVWMFG